MGKSKKSIIIMFSIILLLFLLLCAFASFPEVYKAIRTKLTWKEPTTPLPVEVIEDICSQFELGENDKRCKSDAIVYAPDFFEPIVDHFKMKDGKWSTYDEVQEKLDKYQVRIEPPSRRADGSEYYRVWYDLRGDGIYPIVMRFDSEDKLYKISASIGD
ncbi:MAG: hypothetical protein JEZ00_09655 [Anaerolineaceae bacterium]|nr:hypothetical protein [Anaerolineaceae bacterium]